MRLILSPKIWLPVVLAGIISLTVILTLQEDDPPPRNLSAPPSVLEEVYRRLDPSRPGRGVTDYPGHTVEDIPKGYAMILMAELERERHGIEPGLPNLADVAGRWLIDHSRLDSSGVVGWGVPVAWDAYGDDSINPVNTVYAISTAIVVDALLDWMETKPNAPGSQIIEVVQVALERFAQPEMRTPSGLLPYSLVATDRQYDTFNSAAYLAGQMQRFAKYSKDAALFTRAADDTVRALIDHHQVSPEGNWFWRYSVQEDVSNDLAHASYIVDGLKTYMAEKGNLADFIDIDAVTLHLEEFAYGDSIRAWPRLQENITNAGRLYDIGMAMTLACREPRLADMAKRLLDSVPKYRTDNGFSRYPPVPEVADYVVNEYEAYLWRGLIACEAAKIGLASLPERLRPQPIHPIAASDVPAGELQVGTMLEDGVVLAQLDDQHGGVMIVRNLDRNEIRIIRPDAPDRGLTIIHSETSAPDFRAATIFDGDLVLVYYDNPTLKNYVARYRWSTDGYALKTAPFPLPSFEDPAGSTYEMIPAVFLLPRDDALFLVAGNLSVEIGVDNVLNEQRLANCSRALESVVTSGGPVALCIQKIEKGQSSPFELIGPEGIELPVIGKGIPYNLQANGDVVSITEATNSSDFAAMLRFDVERLNGGWLEYGIDNVEGRIPWSQIYYLNGFLDFIGLQASGDDERWADFATLATQVHERLDKEILILSDRWLSGGYLTRAFSVDRSEQLFAVQTSRLLLLFDRYLTEMWRPKNLPAYDDLRDSVDKLRGHIEVMARSGEKPWWLPPGDAHLVWPKGSAFYFDGLNVPFNHQNEWAYAVHRLGLSSKIAADDITSHFLRRIAPDGILPQTGVWDYWWGRAYDGWTVEDQVSVNTPDYPGDHLSAWISFRSIDATSVLAAMPTLPKGIANRLMASASSLVQDGKLYPFVSQELRRVGLDITVNDDVARRYVRVSSPWEIANAVWAYKALLQEGKL